MNQTPNPTPVFKAKAALEATIRKILDLNRRLKALKMVKKNLEVQYIRHELKILNKVASQQARIVRLYEQKRTDNEKNRKVG